MSHFFAIFHNFVKFSYSHGDVDGKIGDPQEPFVYIEGGSVDLAESTRLMRIDIQLLGGIVNMMEKIIPYFIDIFYLMLML